MLRTNFKRQSDRHLWIFTSDSCRSIAPTSGRPYDQCYYWRENFNITYILDSEVHNIHGNIPSLPDVVTFELMMNLSAIVGVTAPVSLPWLLLLGDVDLSLPLMVSHNANRHGLRTGLSLRDENRFSLFKLHRDHCDHTDEEFEVVL